MRDVERDLLERGELGEVHLSRLDAQQVRVLARFGAERRHDLGRHREESMTMQAEPVRRRAENSLQTRRGVTVGVQGTGELQHEPDGQRVRLAKGQLGGRLEDLVVAQGTLGAGVAPMLLPSWPIAAPTITRNAIATAPTTTMELLPTLSSR